MNIRVWNKTISYGSGFPANPILFALMFSLDVGCLLTCLPYFLLFALWCNLNNLWCNKNTVCCPQLLLLEILYVADRQKPKKNLKKICFIWATYPEPHIFSNVQNWSEKCWPTGNVKIWLDFFSTSFRFQESAVPINQVNMHLNLSNTVLFIFLAFSKSLPAHVGKRIYNCYWCIFFSLE
jgi:hypothetical protein